MVEDKRFWLSKPEDDELVNMTEEESDKALDRLLRFCEPPKVKIGDEVKLYDQFLDEWCDAIVDKHPEIEGEFCWKYKHPKPNRYTWRDMYAEDSYQFIPVITNDSCIPSLLKSNDHKIRAEYIRRDMQRLADYGNPF